MHRRLRSFHRAFGLVAALIITILAVSGILLNHTDELALDEIPVTNSQVLQWYGIKPAVITGFPVGKEWVLFNGKQVYLNRTRIDSCNRLAGAVQLNETLYIACEEKLLLTTQQGELIEAVDKTVGLPVPLESIGVANHQVILESGDGYRILDSESLNFIPAGNTTYSATRPGKIPGELDAYLREKSIPHEINLERVLLDIHSGRILGFFGILLIDAGAILLLLMAFSGLWVWLKRTR